MRARIGAAMADVLAMAERPDPARALLVFLRTPAAAAIWSRGEPVARWRRGAPQSGNSAPHSASLHAGYRRVPRVRTLGANTISRMLHSAIGMNAAAGRPLASQIRPLTTGTTTAHE
jgi:hypothetical protein